MIFKRAVFLSVAFFAAANVWASNDLNENPYVRFIEQIQNELSAAIETRGTSGGVEVIDRWAATISEGKDSKVFVDDKGQKLDLDSFNRLVLSLNDGSPVIIETDRIAATVLEANQRLQRSGISALAIRQSERGRKAELIRELIQVGTLKKRRLEIMDALRWYKEKNTANSPDEPYALVLRAALHENEIARANEILSQELITEFHDRQTGETVNAGRFWITKELAQGPTNPAPISDIWSEAEPSDQRAYETLTNVRFYIGTTLPLAVGPGLEAVGGTIKAATLGASAVSSLLEWQFVKQIKYPVVKKIKIFGFPVDGIGLSQRGFLGNVFWSQQMAKWGKPLPIALNIAYPLIATLAGAGAAALAGQDFKFTVADGIVHPLISLALFGMASFGFTQPAVAKQLEQGYTSRHPQFRFETYSLFYLNSARVLGIVATLYSSGANVFQIGDVSFNTGHLFGYGAMIAYAALISSTHLARDGLKIPFTNRWLVRSALELEDQQRAALLRAKEPKTSWLSQCRIKLGKLASLRY